MSDATPTRSSVLEQKEERKAMHEGYVFLDEKCLLLAGEMLRELAHHASLQQDLLAAWEPAVTSLQAAVARHGLEGLETYAPASLADTRIAHTPRTLMGVKLQDAEYVFPPAIGAAAPGADAVDRSPEAEACRVAFRALLGPAAQLAAVAGNLERLQQEYQRAVRRARALQDVLLPELDSNIGEIETRLEELEQEDAIWMRAGA